MPIIALNNFRTSQLIGTDHFPVLFGIELTGKFSRLHQVAEHDRELATFSFWSMRSGAWVFAWSSVLCQDAFLLHRWLRSGGRFRFRFASPNQHLTILSTASRWTLMISTLRSSRYASSRANWRFNAR